MDPEKKVTKPKTHLVSQPGDFRWVAIFVVGIDSNFDIDAVVVQPIILCRDVVVFASVLVGRRNVLWTEAAKVFKNSVHGGPDFFLFACQMAQQFVKAAICRNWSIVWKNKQNIIELLIFNIKKLEEPRITSNKLAVFFANKINWSLFKVQKLSKSFHRRSSFKN